MLNCLKPYYITITIFPFIIFNLLFKQIYSISGTSSERYSPDSPDVSSNDETICPCDITEGVCDVGCCCDKDCLDLMLSNQYFNINSIDESSYTNKNIDSKLDYCDDYKESLDDLYNPLVLAFKILKRGFCLVKKKEKEEEKIKRKKERKKEKEKEKNRIINLERHLEKNQVQKDQNPIKKKQEIIKIKIEMKIMMKKEKH